MSDLTDSEERSEERVAEAAQKLELEHSERARDLAVHQSERARDLAQNQRERELKTVEKQAEERGQERAENEAAHTEFRRHLAAINGSVSRVDAHMAAVDAHMTLSQTDVVVLKGAVTDVGKDISSVVESLENREKEAREDRRSVKVALYSFVTAIVASGAGALILHFVGAL